MTINNNAPRVNVNVPSKVVTATSAAASAVTASIPAPTATPDTQILITGITLSASGADSGAITVTVKDATTSIMVLDYLLTSGVPVSVPLPAPLDIAMGHAASVVVSAGAASCVVKVNVSYMTA